MTGTARNTPQVARALTGACVWAVSLIASVQAAAPAAGEPVATTPAPALRSEVVDALAEKLMRDYRIPGLAIGVVADGVVVHARGYGVREFFVADGEGGVGAGKNAAGRAGAEQTVTGKNGGAGTASADNAVDGKTLFKIASNTKAMTAAALAILVDRGQLQWTDKVQKYLPEFAMHDDWISREFMVRDLLVHNSGLGPGAGDLMFWPEPNLYTRSDIISGLKHLPPVSGFRAEYAYDNSLYVVAGEIVARISGQSWEQFVERELFAPQGMTRCFAGGFDSRQIGNIAQPHGEENGVPVVVRREPEQIPALTMAAAGGVRCSLDDMLRWVRTLLDQGRIAEGENAGKNLFSARQHALMWTPYTIMPMNGELHEWDRSHFNLYGLGWRINDMDGELKVHHTGSLAGMHSAVALLPERRAGVVILMNRANSDARNIATRTLLKLFTAPADGIDWPKKMQDSWAAKRAQQAAVAGADKANATEKANNAPLVREQLPDMRAYLGRWRDPWFGDVLIERRGNEVWWRSEKSLKLNGRLQHLDGQRFVVRWQDRQLEADAYVDFRLTADGRVQTMEMAPADDATDFSYDFRDLRFSRVGD